MLAPPVRTTIKDNDRLDRALSAAFAGLSRAQAKALLSARGVRLDGRLATTPSVRVTAGGILEIDPAVLDTRTAEARAVLLAKEKDIVVLKSGAGWSALRKPAGLPSVGGFFGDTLHFARMSCAGVGGDFQLADCGLVHRLDNDTSGTSLLAHDAATLQALLALRARGQLARTYWAIVAGAPPDAGFVDTPIAHHPNEDSRMVTGDVPHRGQPQTARTDFVVLSRLPDRALVELKIEGGRRHQIRVHMASIGHAVLGDHLYGTFAPHADWPKRFALHAFAVDFVLGGTEHIVSDPGDHFWIFAPSLRRTE